MSGTVVDVSVPGRVCLFGKESLLRPLVIVACLTYRYAFHLKGEHSDWAGSYRATHSEIEPGYCIVTVLSTQATYHQVKFLESKQQNS